MRHAGYILSITNKKNREERSKKDLATTYVRRRKIETVFHLEIAYLNRSESHDTLVHLHEREVIAVSSCMPATRRNYLQMTRKINTDMKCEIIIARDCD